MIQPLAIQSWCFRNFKPLPQFFEQLKSAGVSAAEVCGVHADFDHPDTFDATIAQFRSAGVKIVCIGVQTLSGDTEKDRPYFEFCRRAGVGHMAITFGPHLLFDGLRPIEKLADEYNLRLGIHNHGGGDWLGNARILKHVFCGTSDRIGLHMDTAWALDAGENPCDWSEKFAPRMSGVHLKDFVFDRAGKPTDVVVGTGNLDLPRLMGILKQAEFSGPLVVEYEGEPEAPVPALRECVKAIQKYVA